MVFLLGKRLCAIDTSPHNVYNIPKPLMIDIIEPEVELYYACNNFVCGFGDLLYCS